ncbi:putative dehydrogenase [Alicyclobacillus sacchari]|uniref:Putative dehydrogenase n=1 Tax=Alicyclobacillus sacchari TaxID=392010 RepID=A0A4R8LL33_9BACL|nr:Gfo/Idh/MocA family oxidoreductase [Alicyclobacillus sacchari]TDY45287.1 putative dehydrogenase [Alicyclobacillus sacchari]
MTKQKLRWGVLGCADIAVRKVIPGIQKSQTGSVIAVASRSQEKADAAATQFGIARAYGNYEELLADRDVDAVYIPLPNHLHKEWTIRAAQAGKHVLCEKPIALSAAEAEEMVVACAKAGVLLAEAFMYRHHPRYERISQIVRSGEIGVIRGIHATFTFNNASDFGNVRYRREWGGGSLYDVGCYPISAARLILADEPVAATAVGFTSSQHDDVDMMVSGLVEFPNAVGLTFDCAMWAAPRNTLEVLGSDGRIEVANAFVGEDLSIKVITSRGERVEAFPNLDAYTLQADDFADALLNGGSLRFQPADAIANMRVIDACLQSMASRQRIEIAK